MAHELKGVADQSGIRLWAVREQVVQHRVGKTPGVPAEASSGMNDHKVVCNML